MYENIAVYSPQNELMFKCSTNRINWYIKKNLVQCIGLDEYRLTFEPRGKGHVGDDYFLQSMPNHCCCCKSTENLQHHHVVPYCFRRWMEVYKKHNHYDVLPLCESCHRQYEANYAVPLKHRLSRVFSVDWSGVDKNSNRSIRCVKYLMNIARVLHHYEDVRTKEQLSLLKEKFDRILGSEGTDADIEYWSEQHVENPIPYGLAIMNKIKRVDRFVRMWRHNFLVNMKPQHLPIGWNKNRPIKEVRSQND